MLRDVVAGVLLLVWLAPLVTGQTATHDGVFRIVAPVAGTTIANKTPEIRVAFVTTNGALRTETLVASIDNASVDLTDDGNFDATGFSYKVPSLFALKDGFHSVHVEARDTKGALRSLDWTFAVDTHPVVASRSFTLRDGVLLGWAGVGLVGLAAGGVWLYAWRAKGITWEKIEVRHPRQRALAPAYASVALSILATLGALTWLSSGASPPRFATEYLLIAGSFVALGPYMLVELRARARVRAYERAFAQFLFEFADALRGGIDPMTCVLELSKTETGVLAPRLRVAADSLRLGRPFETAMENFAAPLRSPLIQRYAALLGEAAKVGGEISSVVHRAARDMDALVKINEERRRQMVTPILTMYIAYGVLLWMVKSMLGFAPGLTGTDFSAAGIIGGSGHVTRLTLDGLQERFFHLTLLTSFGTGLLVGGFTDGKVRYGLSHAFIMVAGAAVFFRVLVL
jgi:hypothetical protein